MGRGSTHNNLHVKVHIFLEGHKILRNLHLTFDWHYIGKKKGEDFAKFCGLLRVYELYKNCTRNCIRNKTFLFVKIET